MEPLLFADHLRRMRDTTDEAPATRRQGFDLAGAGGLVGAACAAWLLLVMLQIALSAPVTLPVGLQIAVLAAEEAAR